MADSGGVYVDMKTQKVVKSEPEEGIQLVAPGQEVTPQNQQDIDAYEAAVKGESEARTVSTKTVSAKAEK